MRQSGTLKFALGLALALIANGAAQAAPKYLANVAAIPDLAFPFFKHMADQIADEATKIGDIELTVTDGQRSSPKETADIEAAITKNVNGLLVDPNDVDALAAAIQEAVDAKIPVVTVDRRVDKVPGILAHVGADNVKGGEAQGQLVEKLFPKGANVMNLQGQSGASPAIDRNKGLHNVLDQGQIQICLRGYRRLRSRQRLGDDGIGARRHGQSARRDRLRQ